MKLSIHSLILRLACMGVFDWMDDERYLRLMYWGRMRKRLNLDPPETFNEKIQWLKLHDRKPEYAKMVDKHEAKKYAADIIGSQYIIPTLQLWNDPSDIDFDSLPEKFVLKCTHDSGGLVICEDKSRLDREAALRKINKSFKKDYYKYSREWPYSLVKPRVIAEPLIETENGGELRDYKFFCFGGKIEMILVCSDRFSDKGLCEDFFSAQWEHLDLRRPKHPNFGGNIAKPEQLDEMKEIVKKLAKDMPFARIDLYNTAGRIYFGEITLFPAGGFEPFVPREWDHKLGQMINI